MDKIIRVLIADDHTLIREGLTKVLSLEKQIKVVGEAADGEEILTKVKSLQPDIVLMDLNMPKFRCVEGATAILKEHPQVKIIALTVEDCQQLAAQLIKAGAVGYLLKDVSVDALISTIKAVYAGETVINPRITQFILREIGTLGREGISGEGEELTAREMDIIKLIAQGKNNREIASELFISEKTVKNHVTHIFRKINVQDRTQAAIYALKAHLTD